MRAVQGASYGFVDSTKAFTVLPAGTIRSPSKIDRFSMDLLVRLAARAGLKPRYHVRTDIAIATEVIRRVGRVLRSLDMTSA